MTIDPPLDPRLDTDPGAVAGTIESLCRTCVVDAGVDGLGVCMLPTGGPPLRVHATDNRAAAIEDLQFTLGEGPSLDAQRSGAPVLVADVRAPADGAAARWPMFLGEATRVGVRAVFAFPVRLGTVRLGVMDLYRVRPGPLSRVQMSSTFDALDSIGRQLLELDYSDPDAPRAYPMTVHQAAGMTMVQLDISIDEALVRLRATAFEQGRPLGELAADVVAGRTRFRKE